MQAGPIFKAAPAASIRLSRTEKPFSCVKHDFKAIYKVAVNMIQKKTCINNQPFRAQNFSVWSRSRLVFTASWSQSGLQDLGLPRPELPKNSGGSATLNTYDSKIFSSKYSHLLMKFTSMVHVTSLYFNCLTLTNSIFYTG